MNMHAPSGAAGLTLSPQAMDLLMPMHVWVGPDGCLRHAGPTITKILGDVSVTGVPLFDLFRIRRPTDITDLAGLMALAGARLSLAPKSADHLPLRGVVMPLPGKGGALLDLSLGLSFASAVRDFALTLHDFSPCDQTIELLYLHEANASTTRLSRHLSERLQAAHASAEHQARTDVLTGLSNRRALDAELEHLLVERNHDFTLLQMDLDLFKGVNDTYGHAAGDAVLMEVGRILDNELRSGDFPARIGGDEFLVVLRPAVGIEVASRIATRLIELIEQPIQFESHVCQISASIGIVSTTQYKQRPTAEQITADADTALYRAKNGGRGRYAVFQGDIEEARVRDGAQGG